MELIDKADIIDTLTAYFEFPYPRPVSYYNAFSCLNMIGKLKRKFSIANASENFYHASGHLVLLVEGSVNAGVVIAPKTHNGVDEICSRLKKNGTDHVLVHVPGYEINDGRYKIWRQYLQVLYDCSIITKQISSDVTEHTTHILGSRSRTSFKKNSRECVLRPGGAVDYDHYLKVMKEWERHAAEKGESTGAVSKDMNCFDWSVRHSEVQGFIGFRGDLPVSYSFITQLPGNREVASILATKSLNYRCQEGGYNETSVWELSRVCSEAQQRGIRYLNSSGTDNKEGLSSFKKRFITNTNLIEAYDYEYCL